MKMPRVYTFDVPDFDDCGGRTMRRVDVPKAVFRQIEADVAAPLHATIQQLGENAAKAAGEYAEEVGRLRGRNAALAASLEELLIPLERASADMVAKGWTPDEHAEAAFDRARAALTEPTDEG